MFLGTGGKELENLIPLRPMEDCFHRALDFANDWFPRMWHIHAALVFFPPLSTDLLSLPKIGQGPWKPMEVMLPIKISFC